ncbi:MAG TPA: hypothetical protein DDZ89_16585 [Clostridiales bacterium]|nr:hypothetical protein [Clostridiales bacterium]
MIGKFKKTVLIFMVVSFLFVVSCEKINIDSDNVNPSITTSEITGEDLSFLTDEPVKIIYVSDNLWGWGSVKEDNMAINYITISELCQEELGFSVKFINMDYPNDKDNAYALYIQSGEAADLIFPDRNLMEKSQYHWGERYIDDGLYMDLTPYLERFCPEAFLNFSRYPDIKDNFTKDGRVYAIYAGMPDITALALLIKNDLLKENSIKIDDIHSIDTLYESIDNLYNGKEPPSETNKIWVSDWTLLMYSIYNSGYYSLNSGRDLVFDVNDPNYKPCLVEDTEILDYFF